MQFSAPDYHCDIGFIIIANSYKICLTMGTGLFEKSQSRDERRKLIGRRIGERASKRVSERLISLPTFRTKNQFNDIWSPNVYG